jgi:hypothetical protein
LLLDGLQWAPHDPCQQREQNVEGVVSFGGKLLPGAGADFAYVPSDTQSWKFEPDGGVHLLLPRYDEKSKRFEAALRAVFPRVLGKPPSPREVR